MHGQVGQPTAAFTVLPRCYLRSTAAVNTSFHLIPRKIILRFRGMRCRIIALSRLSPRASRGENLWGGGGVETYYKILIFEMRVGRHSEASSPYFVRRCRRHCPLLWNTSKNQNMYLFWGPPFPERTDSLSTPERCCVSLERELPVRRSTYIVSGPIQVGRCCDRLESGSSGF